MEKKILEYEKFIKKQVKDGGDERLFRLHTEMVRNFQHERLVHLLIMWCFIFITLGFLGATFAGLCAGWLSGEMLIIGLAIDALITGVSVAYVKHYYFLENHVQGLYKYFEEIEK